VQDVDVVAVFGGQGAGESGVEGDQDAGVAGGEVDQVQVGELFVAQDP